VLIITAEIRIRESELDERFVRASGPGGQNVNKVATAVQIRFDVRHSPSLPDDVRDRLMKIAAGRITDDGILLIEARRFRTQERNRQDARERLVKLVQKAAVPLKPRKPTRRTRAANLQRLESKRRRAEIKSSRRERGEQ
jgi:ribosome-associated protein